MENPKTILSQYKNLHLQCIWNKQGRCNFEMRHPHCELQIS